MKFGYIFAKRLRTTLEKFLDSRSKRFANTTQTFFDKRSFQKLEKNLQIFGQIDKSILAKKNYVTGFFVDQFFSLIY